MTAFCDLGKTEEVDGVAYTRPFGQDSMWIRPLFEVLDDHPDPICVNESTGGCEGCDCVVPCCFEGQMRWKKPLASIRFTSEGLKTE